MVKEPLNPSHPAFSKAVSNTLATTPLQKQETKFSTPDQAGLSGYRRSHINIDFNSPAVTQLRMPAIVQLAEEKIKSTASNEATVADKQIAEREQERKEVIPVYKRKDHRFSTRLYKAHAGLSNRIAQLVRKKVTKKDSPAWIWTDEQEGQWQGHAVKVHPCHSQKVAENKLIGGYTIIDENGKCAHSKTYGPYTPVEGSKDEGHVERQLLNNCEEDLKAAMEDDKTYGDTVLVLLEINQWNTPCSGAKGCTTFLNNKIRELNGIYEEVTVGGRFKAYTRYDSSLSESHPAKATATKRGSVMEEDDAAVEYGEKELTIMHTWTKEDRDSAGFRSSRRERDRSPDEKPRASDRSPSPVKKGKKAEKKEVEKGATRPSRSKVDKK